MIYDSLKPQLLVATASSTTATNIVNANYAKYPSLFDGIFVFIFVGLWLMGIISSFMLDVHPIFFAFSMVLIVFVCITGMIISNFFQELMASASFIAFQASFPMMMFIMGHMLEAVIIIASTIMLALYAKSRM
jgi:hypothetical protein